MQRRFSSAQLNAEKIAADPAPGPNLVVAKNDFLKRVIFGLQGSNREGTILDHSKLIRVATANQEVGNDTFFSPGH